MRDVKQHGYFVEIQDTMGLRMIGLRDREPIRDPETFVAAFFVWKPQRPQAPQPKSGGWILLMAKVVASPCRPSHHLPSLFAFELRQRGNG